MDFKKLETLEELEARFNEISSEEGKTFFADAFWTIISQCGSWYLQIENEGGENND